MVVVTEAAQADRTALVSLLAEMAQHYAGRGDTATLAAAARTLTEPAGRAGPFCLLARAGDVPAGLVSLSGFFPAFDMSWGLLLKDIFIAGAHRGSGVARHLMTETVRFALRRGYTRLDWTADGTNARARAFYAKLGVAPSGKLLYRLDGSALEAAACGDWLVQEDLS